MVWELHPNVSDKYLNELFQYSTFSILPFPYTAGSKLKFLTSLAYGVPVLATSNMLNKEDQKIFPNLFSDCPEDWLNRINYILANGIKQGDRLKLFEYASKFSWVSIAKLTYGELKRLGS